MHFSTVSKMTERVLFGYKRLGVCYPWFWFIYIYTHRDWSPEGTRASCCWMESLRNLCTQKCFACLKQRPVKCLSRYGVSVLPSSLKHWADLSSELFCDLSLWWSGCVTCHAVRVRHRPGQRWHGLCLQLCHWLTLWAWESHVTLGSCYSSMAQKLRSSGFKLLSDLHCWVPWPFLGARSEICWQ